MNTINSHSRRHSNKEEEKEETSAVKWNVFNVIFITIFSHILNSIFVVPVNIQKYISVLNNYLNLMETYDITVEVRVFQNPRFHLNAINSVRGFQTAVHCSVSGGAEGKM